MRAFAPRVYVRPVVVLFVSSVRSIARRSRVLVLFLRWWCRLVCSFVRALVFYVAVVVVVGGGGAAAVFCVVLLSSGVLCRSVCLSV